MSTEQRGPLAALRDAIVAVVQAEGDPWYACGIAGHELTRQKKVHRGEMQSALDAELTAVEALVSALVEHQERKAECDGWLRNEWDEHPDRPADMMNFMPLESRRKDAWEHVEGALATVLAPTSARAALTDEDLS